MPLGGYRGAGVTGR